MPAVAWASLPMRYMYPMMQRYIAENTERNIPRGKGADLKLSEYRTCEECKYYDAGTKAVLWTVDLDIYGKCLKHSKEGFTEFSLYCGNCSDFEERKDGIQDQ